MTKEREKKMLNKYFGIHKSNGINNKLTHFRLSPKRMNLIHRHKILIEFSQNLFNIT